MAAVNVHLFNMTTIRLQDEAETSALKGASAYQGQNLTAGKAGRFSRIICNRVYEEFSRQITERFPSEVYSDLISLTLKSRIKFFFVDLQGRVTNLILGEGAADN